MHLYLALLFHRDYFGHPDSSPACSFVPQGLFRSTGFISSLLFCSAGIISATRIHLYLALLCHRDYFDRPNSSPACFFLPQGLFPLAGFISSFLFCSIGIILTGWIHPTAEKHLCRAIQQPEIYCSSILPIFSAITRVPTAITKTPISIT